MCLSKRKVIRVMTRLRNYCDADDCQEEETTQEIDLSNRGERKEGKTETLIKMSTRN